ncbi:Deoxynucleoside triphosphate triphosphohydrolase SAMHD1 [Smittium mucronatum]|uniref:Deoxynucleoside triphosphate triphosphohydrolase SAMHD1 n=1 Tax=Smittium mucronatum TaxID=133383 RepID=A0A1R0GX48_9FUNG|nr:Deoxynucleoside triphosphate triphosphohydrolase SAMHD1 [Smittium mucronatum]
MRPEQGWTHEKGSIMMLDYLLEQNQTSLTPTEIDFIKDLIMGTKTSSMYLSHSSLIHIFFYVSLGFISKFISLNSYNITFSVEEGKNFLFEIVANKKNGIDVDKFDYISRDCYHVGVKSSYDYTR